jgi:hypothetical protein
MACPLIVLEIYASSLLALLVMTTKYHGAILQGKGESKYYLVFCPEIQMARTNDMILS